MKICFWPFSNHSKSFLQDNGNEAAVWQSPVEASSSSSTDEQAVSQEREDWKQVLRKEKFYVFKSLVHSCLAKLVFMITSETSFLLFEFS